VATPSLEERFDVDRGVEASIDLCSVGASAASEDVVAQAVAGEERVLASFAE
jgi:hypothetical protein